MISKIKRGAALLGALVIALGAAQFAPSRRADPPVLAPLAAPPEVAAILTRSCGDCHSNDTRWPWYTSVAPISWLANRDVEGGRRQINFSDWSAYNSAARRHKLNWMRRALATETMPPLEYQLAHPGAHLDAASRAVLIHWIDAGLHGATQDN
jgi:hypothetical protein